MTHRFPLSEAPDPSARQMVEDSLTAMLGAPPTFPVVTSDGESLTGLFGPACYSPGLTPKLFEMGKTMYQPSFISPRKRELAILGLLSVADRPFISQNHREIGATLGLTAEHYDDGLAGKTPRGLSAEEETVYRLARTLAALSGPLDDSTWEEYLSQLKKTEIVAVAHVVGAYRWWGLLAQVSSA